MNRRSFLRWGGLALFCGSGALRASANPLRAPLGASFAASDSSQQVLVVVFLRGGLDGLHALVPYRSEQYYRARPLLAVPASSALELDDRFALHPALKSLLPHYTAGELALVCAVGTSDRSRSHFIAQDFLEFGGPKARDGWLNRHLTEDGLALSTRPHLPTLLKGARPVLQVSDVEEALNLSSPPALWDGPQPVARLTRDEEMFRKRLSRLRPPSSNPYPESSLAQQLRTVAYLLKQGVELEAAHCELSGFDSHSAQIDGLWPGNLVGLNRLLFDFSEGVDAFWRDLGDLSQRVTLITVTEFGRRLQENGSLGTDHGLASVSFVMGGQVRGGEVHGRWPGLERERLVDGIDLAVTTDYRQLLNEYASAVSHPLLFPEYQATAKMALFDK